MKARWASQRTLLVPQRWVVLAALLLALAGAGDARAAVVIFSSDDRTGADFVPFDGVFLQFQGGTGGQLVAADFGTEEQRLAIEFDISDLSVVRSAVLRVFEISDDQVDASLYGYVGNGTIDLADLNNSNLTNLLIDDVDDGVVDDPTPVDLDVTAFVQSLVANGDDFAGFVARHNNTGKGGVEFPRWRLRTSTDTGTEPRLIVVVDDEIEVTTTADGADPIPGDGVCDDGAGACTLRAAIQTANVVAGPDTVILQPGLYELSLKRDTELPDDQTGDLDVTSEITVSGSGNLVPCEEGADCSCIDARGAKDRAFDVAAGGDLRIDSLSVKNGKAAKNDSNPSQIDEVSGGCIRVGGDLEVEDVSIESCSSPDDGGCIGLVEGASGDLSDTFLTSCKAKDAGGALEADGATLVLDRVTIAGSSAGSDGGAVELTSGSLEAANTTLSDNKAKEGGGLDLEDGATAQLNNVTLASNKAKAGDGANVHVDALSTLTISNSILASKKGDDCSGVVTSDGHNIESGTSCAFAQTGDQSGVDPLLEALADGGGEVPTRALLPGSPAIDRGDDVSCEATDARGEARFDVNGVDDVGTECDVGAYEFIPPM
jgi:CSLREA domain-containing protein